MIAPWLGVKRVARRATTGHRLLPGIAVVIGLLATSLAALVVAGGTDHAPPHWFYVPILFAALRFGAPGGAVVALASGLLVGQVPADVASGAPQRTSDWVLRTAIFVVVGLILPTLASGSVHGIGQERSRRAIEREVRRAIDAGELVLHYQPIRSVRSGRVVGLEALMRWQHPTRGLLYPKDFLDDLASLGSLTTWVLETAFAQTVAWQREHDLPDLIITVNVPSEKISEPDFVPQVQTAMLATGIAPRCVVLEITERTLIDDLEAAADRLTALRRLGLQIAIDDFGTGHAGLSYLQSLPVNVIKIDRSFVMHVTAHRRSDSIIRAIIDLALALEATSVAEGIETTEQLDAVRRLGCPMVQGFLTGPPADAVTVSALLARPPEPLPASVEAVTT